MDKKTLIDTKQKLMTLHKRLYSNLLRIEGQIELINVFLSDKKLYNESGDDDSEKKGAKESNHAE